MKIVLKTGTLLIALLLGIVPPGTCTQLVLNPHGSCCPSQTTNESSCCKDGSGCKKHSKQNLPNPCCAFTPGDLAFVEGNSASHLLSGISTAIDVPAHAFDVLLVNRDVVNALYAHAPPNTAPPCPVYLLHSMLLV